MKVGDVVVFSEEHTKKPGLSYTKDWMGIIVDVVRDTSDTEIEELKIMWSIFGASHIMDYPSRWWNLLEYEPFEVVNEGG